MADHMGQSLARNPFVEDPAPGNPGFSQYEQPQVTNTSSLPSHINMMASLPTINNTNSNTSEGKAIYAGASGGAVSFGSNSIPNH